MHGELEPTLNRKCLQIEFLDITKNMTLSALKKKLIL